MHEPALFSSLDNMSDELFLERAYLILLGRPADPQGLKNYLFGLQSNKDRGEIWQELANSEEGLRYRDRKHDLLKASPKHQPLVSNQSLTQVKHVNDLMLLNGQNFIRAAYLNLFKREPDPEGLTRYMEVLCSGFSRSYVLKQLMTSDEAKEKSAYLHGISALLINYKKAQRPSWRGWYWRHIRGAESDLIPDRAARMLAYAAVVK